VSDLETAGDLLRRIYDEEFGFLPTNASMKPVHVANGLCRRLMGVSTDHTPLARVLRQYVKNQRGGFMEEREPNAAILTDYGDRFTDSHGNRPGDEAMTRFRALAKETLGADNAVFPTQASFTLSHRRMITGDLSDNGSGDFLGSFLTAGYPARPAHAAELIKSLLEEDADPWTTIAWPLLDIGDEQEAPLTGAGLVRADRSAALLATNDNGALLSPTLRELRERFEHLAVYEQAYGAKLTTLRRVILFSAFALHVHMIRRCSDVLHGGPRPPILLDLFDGKRRSLRQASAATLQAGFRAVEHLIVHRIREHLAALCATDIDDYLNCLPDNAETQKIIRAYEAQLTGGDPVDALAEAYWQVGYTGVGPASVKGFPWNALLALGRRAGYLLPYDDRGRGGKEHKRYGANAEFTEIIVAATVTPGEPVEFDDFLDRLRNSFGIVVGRRADFEAIRRNDLHPHASSQRSISVNENDLRANLTAFRDLIIDIGFAKSYADGRTIVTTDGGRR